jgi:histidinol-phosphate aminotransferase
MSRESIVAIARQFKGIVVVDEAYIDFADEPSMIAELVELPNLVILQTFSKAWGMAGVRVGLALASTDIIDLMNRVKPPYNISGLAQRAVVDALNRESTVNEWIKATIVERTLLEEKLAELSFVQRVHRSDANFLLVKVDDANAIYRYLIEERIVVRNRNNVELCDGCLRITVGTSEENARLLGALSRFGAADPVVAVREELI